MAKTEFGCQTLQEKGHFSEFVHFIRQHGHEKEDPELILKLKSILWTVVCRVDYRFLPRANLA
jgi:rapamycin-insensitive companion of mTOR